MARAGGGLTGALCATAFIGSLGAAGFGYGLGVTNEPQEVIESDLGLGHGTVRWSGVVAAFTAFAFLATLLAPRLVDQGRRRFLMLNQLVFLVGGGFLLASGLLQSHASAAYALLIIGRSIFGLASGAATVAVPLYLNEIAPAHLTGALGSLNQFQITLWILISQAVGVGMSTSDLWGWMLGAGGLIGGVGFLLTFAFLPESPRWLVSRGRIDEAATVLAHLRGSGAEAVAAEIDSIRADAAAHAGKPAPSLGEIIRTPGTRKALIIATTLQIAQQLSGINAVFFYSSSFFTDAGISNPNFATLACGAVNVLATGLAVYIIDKLGRKPLLLVGSAGMLVSAAAIVGTLAAKDQPGADVTALGGASIGFVLLFVTFFEIGLGPIPWLIGGEMLPEGPRSTVMGIAAAANWIFTTVVGLAFGPVQKALGKYSFLPFCVFLLLTIAFTWVAVPETKGRSPSQVLAQLAGKGYNQIDAAAAISSSLNAEDDVDAHGHGDGKGVSLLGSAGP